MKKIYTILLAMTATVAMADTTITATFEDTATEYALGTGGYYTGMNATDSTAYSTFTSGSLVFSMYGNNSWSYWEQFGFSNQTDTAFSSAYNVDEQLRVITGGGADNSATYAVAYCGYYGVPTITYLGEDSVTFSGMYITNTAYTYSSLTNGDGFAHAHATGDWLMVTITASNGNSIDYYLSDFTSADSTEHYIVDTWQWVDLTSLGKTSSLSFSMSGSDSGDYGLNTPAYFALDNVTAIVESDDETAISTADATTDAPTITGYYDASGRRYSHLQRGMNIIRYSDGTTRKVVR